MRRYFFEERVDVGQKLMIRGELFHHIFEVCRLQPGQHFELLNDQGLAYLVTVDSITKKEAVVLVKEARAIPAIKKPHIHLYLCIPKIPTFETIVEKSVELGVSSITPVFSDFSFFRTHQQFPIAKLPRWQKIILQATQQSGRGTLLKLEPARKLDDCIKEVAANSDLKVIAYEGETSLSLKTYLSQKRKNNVERVHLFVGSEGGFSDSEIELFKNLDLPPVTLGDQVLRVETACLTLVASLKYEFDLLS